LQVPLKPEPKECTKAEPFQLESLVRHQEEQQRQAEERAKAEQIEAALKEFHAYPNLSKYNSSSSPSCLS
jgi:targeting protein for Xklp2